jgi:hypothetical protein
VLSVAKTIDRGVGTSSGKNQIPDKGAEPIYIPALPLDSDSVSLCPVRILSIYLTRTALRSSTNKRLVIPIKKGVSYLSVKTSKSNLELNPRIRRNWGKIDSSENRLSA